MSKSIKFSILGLLFCVAIGSAFWLFTKKDNHKYPTFSVNQKFVGQELTAEEQKLFDKISADNTKFVASLSTEHKSFLNSISDKVKTAVQNNSRIKIKYKDLLTKDENEVVRLVRKYRKEMREKSPVDKKLYSNMMKKLTQEQTMGLSLYIK